jgi:hypothetical protein
MTATNLLNRLIILWMLATPPMLACAAEYLFYFDVSDSTHQDQRAHLQEFERFVEQRLNSGDSASLLLLNGDTRNFAPFLRGEIKAPPGGASEKKKRELIGAARANLVIDAAGYLKRTPKANSTNILGALISAADHYRQERVPVKERCLVIFTDGLEASALSGVNMEKTIPKKIPSGLPVPSDLQAEIHMIGVKPPAKAGAQESMRSFWEDAASRTGSRLVRYIRGT